MRIRVSSDFALRRLRAERKCQLLIARNDAHNTTTHRRARFSGTVRRVCLLAELANRAYKTLNFRERVRVRVCPIERDNARVRIRNFENGRFDVVAYFHRGFFAQFARSRKHSKRGSSSNPLLKRCLLALIPKRYFDEETCIHPLRCSSFSKESSRSSSCSRGARSRPLRWGSATCVTSSTHTRYDLR